MGTKLNQAASKKQASVNGDKRAAPAPLEAAPAVTAERIQARAFEIFQSRSEAHGDPLADWLQAERELRSLQQWSDGGRS
jgi:hypothetical protein